MIPSLGILNKPWRTAWVRRPQWRLHPPLPNRRRPLHPTRPQTNILTAAPVPARPFPLSLWSNYLNPCCPLSKKNVLVPRLFLLFSLLDVPYISRGLRPKSPSQLGRCKKLQNSFLLFPDLKFGAGTVRVTRSTFRNIEDSPKSKKGRRTIYLDSRTPGGVRALLADRTSGRVFMTKLGTPLKVGDVDRYVLRPICKKVGIPHGRMHAFRHGRVSKMQGTAACG
jgi:hypothetical protein